MMLEAKPCRVTTSIDNAGLPGLYVVLIDSRLEVSIADWVHQASLINVIGCHLHKRERF